MRKRFFILIMVLTLIGAAPLFSQGQEEEVSEDILFEEAQEFEWAWGDVVSVDAEAQTITVDYFDFDTDTEITGTFTVNADTRFEDVDALDKIRQGDSVSIDYSVTPDGDFIAAF